MTRHFHIVTVIAVLLASSRTLSLADQIVPAPHTPIMLDLPARCQLGETCWVVNYVDVDPGSAAKDFRCQARTYDGHDGIDLAIRNRGVMEQGMPVVAAAPGIVRRVRDGVADVDLSNATSREAIAGRECGNGVVIDHGNGWETQYCHLKEHSVRVAIGQRVERGSEVGLIGLSGKTEFPHVHLAVRHEGQVIDPFTGRSNRAGCGGQGQSLWREHMVTYEDVALYHAGFSAQEPQADTIRLGQEISETLSPEAAALVLWVDMFSVQADDRLRFRITAPDGHAILDREQRIDRAQARRFAFAGLRRQGRRWPSGTYNGELRLQRGAGNNKVIRIRTATVQIP